MSQLDYRVKYLIKLLMLVIIIAVIYKYDMFMFLRTDRMNLMFSFPQSVKLHQFSRYSHTLHIITLSDAQRQQDYQQHSSSVFCYAHRYGYHFSIINPDYYYMCSNITSFYFRKHCAVMIYLIRHPNIQWLVVLDGDTFIVNASKSLDSFIPRDPNIHIIHYERFVDNEVVAGNYIIRNHAWSLLYLYKWINYFTMISNIGYHNGDNGALHLHFIDMIGEVDNRTIEKCFSLYKQSHNERLYMDYVACTKCALKGKRKFLHIILNRRAHSFCRDIGLSPFKIHYLDIMMHGYKSNLNYFFEEPVNTSTCIAISDWTPKIRQALIVRDIRDAKLLMKEWERDSSKRYPNTVMYPEIADCWPDCETEVTGEILKKYTSKICNNTKFKL